VKGFDPLAYIGLKESERMDRFTQFAVAASLQAIQDAGLKMHKRQLEATGVGHR